MIYNITYKQNVLVQLGNCMAKALYDSDFDAVLFKAKQQNGWFTAENIKNALSNWQISLSKDQLQNWLQNYTFPEKQSQFKIGLILAGNIPLVGLHDILCVYLSNHTANIKASSADYVLIEWVLKALYNLDPQASARLVLVERLVNVDAVIATGSNNSARYFEQYFGHKPHIIRKNRHSLALLAGDETLEELSALSSDIFNYFGLGCRNVTHLLVPENYNWQTFWQAMIGYQEIGNLHKYANNFDYNLAITLLNQEAHVQNGFLILKASTKLSGPVGTLYYSIYKDLSDAINFIAANESDIQCVVSKNIINNFKHVSFGMSQCPALDDYADKIDTLAFLAEL